MLFDLNLGRGIVSSRVTSLTLASSLERQRPAEDQVEATEEPPMKKDHPVLPNTSLLYLDPH